MTRTGRRSPMRMLPDSMMSQDDRGDPVESIAILAAAILRRWKLVVLVAVAMLVGVYAAVQMMSDGYDVEASLLATIGRENLDVPTAIGGGGVVSNGVRKEDINSDVTLLEDRGLVEKTVDDIGVEAFLPQPAPPVTLVQKVRRLARDAATAALKGVETLLVELKLATALSPRDKVVNKLEHGLYVRRSGESDVIQITVRWSDPAMGVRFLNRHIENFLTQRAIARRSVGAADFFADKVEASNKQLADLDAEIKALRSAERLTSVSEERDHLLARVAELDDGIAAADAAADAANALSAFASRADGGSAAGSGAASSDVRERLGALVIERAQLLQSYAPGSEPLREVEGKIGQLTALLSSTADKEIATLTGERSEAEARLAALTAGEMQLDRLSLERELAKNRYSEYMRQLEIARVGAELERRRVANIAVLSPPTAPPSPSAPRKLMIVLISAPLGLVLGIALAGLLAYVDKRIYTERELGRIRGLTILGTFRERGLKHA